MPYHFEYSMTDNDFYEMNRFHQRNTPTVVHRMLVIRLIVAILVFYIIYKFTSYALPWGLVSSLAVGVLGFFAFPWLMDRRMRNDINRLKRRGRLVPLQNVSLDFQYNSFTETASENSTDYLYSEFDHVGVGRTAIYLYKTRNAAVMVPNRVFGSEEERADFLAFIKSKTDTGEE